MVERRWLLRLVPPAAGALAVGLIAVSSIGAADGAWVPPDCPGGIERLVDAARDPGPDTLAEVASEPWFTLDPRLDAAGTLAGQRLHPGTGRDRVRFVDLPAESAAAGPFGRLVLVAADDGRRSEVLAVDPVASCAWTLASSTDVIRRVTLDPGASAVYEFRVDRDSRADLGVWRRPLDGSAERRVLGPPPRDPEFGVTWSTSLGWSGEGDRLVIQSCGALRCRTRLLDPVTGAVTTMDQPHQGELVGVAGGRLVGYEACLGLPCPLVSVDLADGSSVVLEADAGLATIVDTGGGPQVAIEKASAPGHLAIVRPDGRARRTLHLDSPLHLVPGHDRAAAGTRLPPGWLATTPDGRSPDGAVLVRLSDGAGVGLREVTR